MNTPKLSALKRVERDLMRSLDKLERESVRAIAKEGRVRGALQRNWDEQSQIEQEEKS